jgi:hypothetical protein
MVDKIGDDAFWKGLGEYQTQKLLTKFKDTFPNELETIKNLK